MARNMWILKPNAENCGSGIEVIHSYDELHSKVYGLTNSASYIIQKYIELPLLYKGKKFDIRVIGLIDCEHNFYVYKDCYLRTSSEKYSLDAEDRFVHLTNNCL